MRSSTRWWLGLILLAIPALFFVPGFGLFESGPPAELARRAGPDGTWYYRVRQGEVLSKIAERELGAHLRYEEILRLNPGLKPRALRPGSVLRMPPRTRAPASDTGTAPPDGPASKPAPGALLLSILALVGLLVLLLLAAARAERGRVEA